METLLYIFILAMLAFSVGSYIFYKFIPHDPHNLKRKAVKIYFDKSLPKDSPGNVVCKIEIKKKMIYGIIGVLIAGVLLFTYSTLTSGYIEYIVYVIALGIALIYYVDKSICHLEICENAIILKQFLRKKVYYYAEIDCIETYNIVNMFNKGVGFGYQVTKNGHEAYRFDNDRFDHLTHLEETFLNDFNGVIRVEKQD